LTLSLLWQKAHRIRWRIIGAISAGIVTALASTAFAADTAAARDNEKLLLAVVGLCTAVVGSMLAMVKALFSWLRRVEPTLPRRDRREDPRGQDIFGTDGEWKVLREQSRWQSQRLTGVEERMDKQEKHLDMRLDEMQRDSRAVQGQVSVILASQARLAQAIEALANRLPGAD
jgi:hypothetical protein